MEIAIEFVLALESRRSPCSSAKASAHADAGFGSVGMSLTLHLSLTSTLSTEP